MCENHRQDRLDKPLHTELPEGHTLSRRDFMKVGIGALGALAVLELGGVSLMFLQSRSQEGEFGDTITAGPVDNFPAGSVTEFTDGRFFLLRAPDGGFLALHNRCPHLGCTVTWEPHLDRFLCPCHASTFDFYGNFDNPPVPRPLDAFSVRIQDGVVLVDTFELRRRENFAPEQLTYA
ncbi:MAG: Rieske (2Fe-2S) protein [Anaerolineae bacterium]|nr:Rieske (2Fe-2S) protein [Anaerolineae bacterium]